MSRAPVPAPVVVCSILDADPGAALARIAAAPSGCGLVELRADRMHASDVAAVVRRSARPLVVTVRSTRDGGAFDGSEDERVAALAAALAAGARFVDVEHGSAAAALAAAPEADGRVIVSSHGGACDVAALLSTWRAMGACRAAVRKLVPFARTPDDVLAVRAFLARVRGEPVPVAAFASGRAATCGRVLAPAWGSWATYGAAEAGAETAAGQPTARDLLEVYDVLRIGPATRLYALVGARVGASPSPALHAAGYARVGLDARYVAIETERFDAFARAVGPEGLAVAAFGATTPFKDEAARRARAADAIVARTGAANTVVAAAGTWRAYNTDGPAALACLRRRLDPRGLRAAVVGAGGTGRAIAAALARAGARVVLFNRDATRARRAAARLGIAAAPLDALPGHVWDALLHATPAGTDGERWLDPRHLGGRFVLDAVYRPGGTALVLDARARGVEAADGYEMLAAQGARQFRRMTGRSVPTSVLERAARAAEAGRVDP